ncbi:MAG: hypothetical protein RIR91_347 [Verrucomicrobiota bacterium]|jgi:hypothetical protein
MRLPQEIRTALDATGLPWAIENGGRHRKVRLAGRLVGVFSKGRAVAADRAMANVVAQIRRAAHQLRKEP